MAVATDGTVTTGTTDGTAQITFSHTVGSGSERFLRVGVGWADTTISSVTYGGSSLGSAHSTANNGVKHAAHYSKVAPASGAANVVVTFAASASNAVAGASAYIGVDQATPTDTAPTPVTFSGTTGGSISVTSAVGDMTVTSGYVDNGVAVTTNKTEDWDATDAGTGGRGFGDHASGAASNTHTWTVTTGTGGIVGMNINASGGATIGGPVFDGRTFRGLTAGRVLG